MKKIILSISALLLIAGSCVPQEKTDIAKEEEAIKAVIKQELALWWDQDYIAEANLLVKEDYLTSINNNGNIHTQSNTWDSAFIALKRYAENENWQYVSNVKVEHKNFNIKVYDKVAWAVCYVTSSCEYKGEPIDIENSVRVVFLEKRDDKWKIALMAITELNPCETEDNEDDE